ncbi:S8 family serine peptidase [Gemmata sp. JC673]|uniref:S8 family serine peptidase n=1 Tax=Gemmata algarum TaxID=2975278 RepID=A0ABU5F1D9_9BACT|nr:S8 family serine peptidase [Gemmata algarum]MDY3559679.1 S8 family serine peptidase [Gemmata algarum]
MPSPRRILPTTLRMEALEDRVVPDGTPGTTFVPTAPDTITVEWQGQTKLAAPGRWIVQVNGMGGTIAEQTAAVESTVAALGLNVHVEQYLGLAGQFRLAGPAELDAQTLAAALSQVPGVQSVEPDFMGAAGQVIPNDAEFARLWGMNNTGTNPGVAPGTPDADADAPEAWDLTGPNRGSTQVITAVVDSGVDYTHPDLYLNIWLNQTEIPTSIRPTLLDTDADGLITFWDLNAPANAGKVADNNLNGRIDAGDILRPVAAGGWMDAIDGNAPGTANGYADDLIGWDFYNNENDPDDEVSGVWHGTHVAGTIAAIGNNGIGVTGVTWRNQIMVVRGLGPTNSGPFSALIGGLNYAVANGAKVSNHSWGGSTNAAALEAAVANARDNGHLMIVAAGNGGADGFGDDLDNPAAEKSYPAAYSYDNIISVANLTNTDARSTSSNYGLVNVDLGAPGTNVFSTMHSRFGPSYGYLSGTSMATPHVTGAAALMLSVNPTASYTQIRNAILQTVDPVSALRTNGPTPVATGGRLNVARAVQAVGFTVASTTPAAGAVVSAPPTEFVVDFTQPYAPASVQPSDLTVNGIAATGVALTDTDTLTFTFAASPVTAEGLQTIAIAAGAFDGATSGPVAAFSAAFRYDAVPLAVVSVSPVTGTIVAAPFTFVDVTFNEPVNPTSLQASDLTLSRGTVVGAEVLAGTGGRTMRFSLTGLTTSGPVTATLNAGAVEDASGNPGPAAPVTVQYDVNTLASVFPVPLTALSPLGSLAYTGSTTGAIATPAEVDPFTLSVDAGQTITIVVTPGSAASSLRPTIQLRNPAGQVVATVEAPAAGVPAVLQLGQAATTGTYTIAVGALAGADTYSLSVLLNAAVEAESVGGPSNGTRATAQALAPAFLALLPGSAAQRAAVRGQLVNAASGTNLITNGNFETGNFNGWTVTPFVGANGWRINNGTIDPASPAGPLAPIGGAFDALTDSSSGGTRVIAQSFVVPAGVQQATLSWSDRLQNFASQFQDPNQEFRVVITDAVGNVLQTVFSTNLGDPLLQTGPNNRSFDVTALLQSRAGQVLQLRFEQQDSLFYFNVTVDNVALTVGNPSAAPSDDFYALDLTAGQRTDLVLGLSGVSAAPSFAATRTDFAMPAGRYPIFVGYRDLNGDGKLDMVAAINDAGTDANGAIGVRLGNGDGTFGTLTQYATGTVFTRYLDFGDVNGDGKLDVVASSDRSSLVSLFLGNGNGTFQAVQNTQAPPSGLGLTVADVNGDGRADAVVPHYAGVAGGPGIVSVLLGQANGTLGAPVTYSAGTGGFGSFGTDVGDLNGDGRPDIVTANFASGTMSVLLQQPNGTFGPATNLSMAAGAWDIELADLNGDGRLDAVTGNQNANNVAVRLGNGDGTFGNPTFFSTGGSGPRTVAVGDVNNDGKLDVLVPNISSATVSILAGNGDGTFGAPLTFGTGSNPNAATLADVNGDGLLDISSADPASGSVSVRLNTTPTVRLELQDAAGNVVATATRGATNFDQGLQFTPTASGTYYARVYGTAPSATYTLVATRAAAFDAEPNDTPATAQNISGTGGALGAIAATGTVSTVAPGANANADGNFNNSFPFNIGGFGIPTMRYQQIYSASQFGTTGIIDALRFRQDAAYSGNFTATLNVKIVLSYAARTTTTASAVFADNIGAGAVTVLDGLVTISSTPSASNPRPFDIVIDVANLFSYDPSRGDLLVDISMRNSPAFFIPFDAVGDPTGTVTRIYQTDVNAPVGITPELNGLITRFDMLVSGDDWYALDLAAGERVRLTTTTPAGGPGEFVNPLNPRIELYDPAGNLVTAGTPLLDNRNEGITFTAPAAGRYRVRVTGENNTGGEYFLGVNRTPVAAGDLATTAEDTPVAIPVLANDSDDVGLDPATVAVVTGPANGTVSVSAVGVVTYTPNANFSGTDSFTYTVKDGGGEVSNVATVSINVTAVADAPTLVVGTAAAGNENTPIPLDISAALTDLDGSEALSITIAGVPTGGTLSAGTDNGNGTWTLTPTQLVGLTILLPDNLPGDATLTLTVTATATEQSNGSTAATTATAEITVRNVAPTATLEVPAGGVEGSPVSVTLTGATDVSPADAAAGFEYAFDFGSGYGAFGASNTASFTPTDNGTYTVRAKVRDKDGGVTEYTSTVVIDNAAPTANAGVDQTVNEGTPVTLTGSFTDAGAADTHTLSWSVSASNGQVIAGGTGAAFAFTPTDNGTYTVTVTVTDDDGGVGTDTVVVTVNNVAPTVDAGPDQVVNEGAPVTLTGGFIDPGTAGTHTRSWSVSASNGQVIAGGTGATFSFVPTDNGTYTVTFTVTDDDGGIGTDTAVVTVNNVAPVANAGADRTVNEGTPVTLTGLFTDAGAADTHTLSWSVSASNGQVIAGGTGAAFAFTPTDNGTYTVTFTVTDDDGGVGTDTVVVTVNNVAPAIAVVGNSAPTIGAAAEGQTVIVTAVFTDAGAADTHTATINWGDGTVTTGPVLEIAGFGAVAGGHSYSAGGVYTITVTLTDDDGGTTTATTRAYVSGVSLRDGVLTIVGTGDDDDVRLSQQGNSGLRVQADFLPGGPRNFSLAGVQRVVALLGAGNDRFDTSGNMTVPMVVDGGAGNDRLSGGRGRNILIGGTGADELTGGKDEDILIGGTTAFDGDSFALAQLLVEWADPTKSLAKRVANLTDGSGGSAANGGHFLTAATVTNDTSNDRLTGKQDTDWFFADLTRDRVDLEPGDLFGEQ